MRCKNCKYYKHYVEKGYEECIIVQDIEISVNEKGEEGCRYNQKTLDKAIRHQQQILKEELIP